MNYTIYYHNGVDIIKYSANEDIIEVIIYWYNHALKNDWVDINIDYIASEYGDMYWDIKLPTFNRT